jgi:hypothetical protein
VVGAEKEKKRAPEQEARTFRVLEMRPKKKLKAVK